jgi:putative oxidoreductase
MADLSISASTRRAGASTASQDTARLLLRLAVGCLILLHGISKIKGGPGFVVDVVGKAGLPAATAYLVYVGEVLAPVLLIIGLWPRAAALVVAIIMVVALALVHHTQFFTLSGSGGSAIELQLMYLVAALAIALLGAGRYSLGGRFGRWT